MRVWITESDEQVQRAADEMLHARVERVVLCGGDGTLMAGVTALRRASAERKLALPRIVVAPAGTVDTMARNFGQRASWLHTVEAVARGCSPRRSVISPSLAVSADSRHFVGFIFGTGLVARFFEKYYAEGGKGYRQAARIVLRTFLGSFVEDAYSASVLDPLPCEVEVDGHRLEPTAFSLVVASVVRDLGLHLIVTPQAGTDPARPHVVAKALSVRRLGPQVHRVLRGRPIVGPGFDGLSHELRVRFPGPEGPWVLDGDVMFSKEVSVRGGPSVSIDVF